MQDRILKTAKVNWRELLPLQPEKFKNVNNADAIRDSLKKYGFAMPFFVWQDPAGRIYAVDGHTRKAILQEMEGVPDELTANFIDARDRKEAVRILLDVYNQKQNTIDGGVLTQFIQAEQITVEEVAVQTLNLDKPAPKTPVMFTASGEDKPPVLKITFSTVQQLQKLEEELKPILEARYPGATYSISAGAI